MLEVSGALSPSLTRADLEVRVYPEWPVAPCSDPRGGETLSEGSQPSTRGRGSGQQVLRSGTMVAQAWPVPPSPADGPVLRRYSTHIVHYMHDTHHRGHCTSCTCTHIHMPFIPNIQHATYPMWAHIQCTHGSYHTYRTHQTQHIRHTHCTLNTHAPQHTSLSPQHRSLPPQGTCA